MNDSFSRRKFLGTSALGAAGVVGAASLLNSCSDKIKPVTVVPPPKKADDGTAIKVGLIGCGGRGTGAVINLLDAGDNIEIIALADLFDDRITGCRSRLKEQKGVELADENCFVGFDAYQKLLDKKELNYVILATPPHFRPEHFEAAVKQRKNVFMEKPVAVDPTGARRVLAAGKQAESLGLSVVAGTQRRHQWNYLEVYEHFKSGAIGDFAAGYAYWNGVVPWVVMPQPDWSEMEAMLRNWVNWMWLSGDHIVEQHLHNIDVVNWYKNGHPIKAVGFGSRQRRISGDQFDNFSIDFVYDDETHMHSMCRQMDGCAGNVSEFIRGTKGYTNCNHELFANDGSLIHATADPRTSDETELAAIQEKYNDPYVQEHIDLVNAIRRSAPINEAENVANSTMTAIMGRISAYTGKEVTWEELLNSDIHYQPKVYDFAAVDGVPKEVPVPGTEINENRVR